MRQRKGAFEFETGEWLAELPQYKTSELKKRARKCVACCNVIIPAMFTPWKELCEDFFPICQKCKPLVERKETVMSENPKQPNAYITVEDALKKIEAEKPNLKAELSATLTHAKKLLNLLLLPQMGFTFESIFSDPEFEGIADTFRIQAQKAQTKPKAEAKSKTKQPAKTKRKKTKANGDVREGSLKDKILKSSLMQDGKWHKRPEIKAALEADNVAVSNLYGMSGVEGLVKDGKLEAEGKKHSRVYRIIPKPSA